jgi:hypothetical protein
LDGDLRVWTWVDVLPPDGMQEVSGSSPLSSTGQKLNSNESNSEYSSKVSNGGRVGRRTCVRIGRLLPAGLLGRTPDFRRCIDAGQRATWGNTRLIGPVTFATWSPPALLEG